MLGQDADEQEQREGHEGRGGEVRAADELHVSVDASRVVGERVEGLHGTCYEGDEHDDDGCIVELECHREPFRPCPVRMTGSQNSLGED